jgi:hypothetical protein
MILTETTDHNSSYGETSMHPLDQEPIRCELSTQAEDLSVGQELVEYQCTWLHK